ncbi:MAG: NAD(+) synthase [Patescibacteria group bacterium]
MNYLLTIDPAKEKERIVSFLKKTFAEQRIDHAVIGLSGGIDSAVSFALLKEILPPEKIIVAHLYYEKSFFAQLEPLIEEAKIPAKNVKHFSIKHSVEELAQVLGIKETQEENIRKGNISARIRMIVLFDLAKKYNALVCGTENKSENLLSYFTRFGDQASDIEPIEHLYKTQVYQLATYLGVPEEISKQSPSAGLWQGQTDEGEFGFTYEEADKVLYLHLEQGVSVSELEQQGYAQAKNILHWRERNLFKHHTPYILSTED